MRRLTLLFVVMGAMLAVSAGAALAATETGGSGNDVLKGTDGPDTLRGGSGADLIFGFRGADLLYGNSGWDRIHAGAGPDVVSGDSGADVLHAGLGQDNIFGDSGNDVVYAKDGYQDYIDCGSGNDWVQYDAFDVLKNCEAGPLPGTPVLLFVAPAWHVPPIR